MYNGLGYFLVSCMNWYWFQKVRYNLIGITIIISDPLALA